MSEMLLVLLMVTLVLMLFVPFGLSFNVGAETQCFKDLARSQRLRTKTLGQLLNKTKGEKDRICAEISSHLSDLPSKIEKTIACPPCPEIPAVQIPACPIHSCNTDHLNVTLQKLLANRRSGSNGSYALGRMLTDDHNRVQDQLIRAIEPVRSGKRH